MTGVDHIAAADCERCRPGPVAQPINTVSSLAFGLAGSALVARARRGRPPRVAAATRAATQVDTEVALGWSAIAAGLGSVAYHGPGSRAGQVAHDASLLTMLGAVVVADATRVTGRAPLRGWPVILTVAATAAALSPYSVPAQIVAGSGAVVAETLRVRDDRAEGRRGWRPYAESLVALLGATGHVLGRTGGPLCRPESRWQAHAAWHTAMAAVLLLRD